MYKELERTETDNEFIKRMKAIRPRTQAQIEHDS